MTHSHTNRASPTALGAASVYITLAILFVAVTSTACVPWWPGTRNLGVPTVTVDSPRSEQTVPANQQILVVSTSGDADGVQRVEMWVDGVLARVDINPDAASPYVVAQPWQSNKEGAHVIVVKAVDRSGNEGQSQPLVVVIEASSLATAVTETRPSPAATLLPPTERPRTPVSTKTSPPLATLTAVPAPTTPASSPAPVCTPPACQAGEMYYCPDVCPGGCGTQCATPTVTATPPKFGPTDIDTHPIFLPLWEKPEVKDVLGYPSSAASDNRQYARQYFERGYMYWWDRPDARGLIWVVQMPDTGAMAGFGWIGPFEDTWDGGDPVSCDAARNNTLGPRSGFGRLWCEHPEIAQTVGAAREPERGTGESADYGVIQLFQGGTMLYSPLDREVWVLINGGAWQRYFR